MIDKFQMIKNAARTLFIDETQYIYIKKKRKKERKKKNRGNY